MRPRIRSNTPEELNENNNDEGLMDMDSVVEYLCIRKSTLYQLCSRKKITVVKIGTLNKFRKADLDDFIKRNVVDAES